jgi:hypothetical protein
VLTAEGFDQWQQAADILGEAWKSYGDLMRSAGYAHGYWRGFDDGERARDDQYQSWWGVAKTVLDGPSQVELARLRAHTDDPCAVSCGRCSRCIRHAATIGNLKRFGTVDYPGNAIASGGAL